MRLALPALSRSHIVDLHPPDQHLSQVSCHGPVDPFLSVRQLQVVVVIDGEEYACMGRGWHQCTLRAHDKPDACRKVKQEKYASKTKKTEISAATFHTHTPLYSMPHLSLMKTGLPVSPCKKGLGFTSTCTSVGGGIRGANSRAVGRIEGRPCIPRFHAKYLQQTYRINARRQYVSKSTCDPVLGNGFRTCKVLAP